MALLKLEIPHSLPVDEAKKRLEALFSYWNRKYSIASTWQNSVAQLKGKAMGVSVDGQVEISPRTIVLQAPDPGMLLRGQAQKYLARKVEHYLNPGSTLDEIVKRES
jgi:Putative polyhydroxyalkanoic acid system protein (PHA_gran_rgn)